MVLEILLPEVSPGHQIAEITAYAELRLVGLGCTNVIHVKCNHQTLKVCNNQGDGSCGIHTNILSNSLCPNCSCLDVRISNKINMVCDNIFV